MGNNDFKIILQALLDQTSLTDIEKKLAKKKIQVGLDIDFANTIRESEKQVEELSKRFKSIFNFKTDSEAMSFTKKYLSEANIIIKQNEQATKQAEQATIKAEQAKQKEIEKTNAAIKKSHTSDAHSNLAEEVQSLNKIADLKARIITQNSSGNESQVAVLQKELSIEQEHYNTIQREASKYTDIISNEERRKVLKDASAKAELKVEQATAKVNDKINKTATAASKVNKSILSIEKLKLTNQIDTWMRVNTKADQFNGRLEKIKSDISILDDISGLPELRKQFQEVNSEADKLGLKGKSLFDKLWSGMKDFASWTFGSSMVMQGVQTVKDMNRNVIKLNSAMIDLRKVTDLTDSSYKEFLESATPKAKQLGTAISDIVEATAEWSKLGYSNINEASKYAETSTIYKNVGDINNVETSIKNINSAMKAFDTKDAEHIIDVYNELGNTMGVSSGDIGQGMQKSASALALTGNSLEQVAALLAGGGEITGEVTELANAAKVGALRLASMKGKLEEIGEEYEDIESISATQTKIYNFTKGQVDIYDEQNQRLKSSYEIWRDIANVFDDIDALDQNSILELLFGKNRANQGAAILKGFQNGQIDKALENALNSEGSAMKEYQNYMQGIQYSLDSLGASFEELSSTVIDSGLIKFFVDLGNTGVNSVNELVKTLSPLGTLLTVGGGILGANGLGLT